MSKLEIKDLTITVTEEISEEQLLLVIGGLTASQLSNNLNLAAAGLWGAGIVSASFGGPIGMGVGAVLGLSAAGFAGFGAVAAMYSK